MIMANNRRYSLARYSVNQERQTVAITETFSETLRVLAGAAVPVDFRERYSEACQGVVRGTVSIISTLSGLESLHTQAQMLADVIIRIFLNEAFQVNAFGKKNTPAALNVQESLGTSLLGSKNTPASLALEDALFSQPLGSKDVPGVLMAAEVLTSMMAAISQTTQRAIFQVTIPPGGELRIDSELFTVLLNGENVLYAQSGDWINISRELLRITVECASGGGLSGQLIYTERYL